MAIVQVTLVKGRTAQQKAEIAAAMTKVMVEVAKSPPDHVNVVFQEIERDNWAVAGLMLPDYVAKMATR